MTVNKVMLLGNLGKDPELKQMKNGGDAYLLISIATSETRKTTKLNLQEPGE